MILLKQPPLAVAQRVLQLVVQLAEQLLVSSP